MVEELGATGPRGRSWVDWGVDAVRAGHGADRTMAAVEALAAVVQVTLGEVCYDKSFY